MAYVSIRWGKSSNHHLNYALKDRAQDDVTYAHDCTPETAISDFAAVRAEHDQDCGNHVLHVMQSFSPIDSRKLEPDEFNSIGRSLALRIFPGHQFVVRTHTDTDKIHNHIVVNTVNSETGKKIENKRRLIHQLQDSSDGFCKEYGLSVINREAKDREARLPYKVQQMVRAGKKSYIFDLAQKADVARSIATNFDEYRDVLGGFGIRTLIEEKNISYFYPGQERGKRGSKLGRNYDKPGLTERFTANGEKFASDPKLKAYFLEQSGAIQEYGMPRLPDSASRFTQLWNGKNSAWNGPSSYTKIARRESERAFKSDRELARTFVPATEIKRAREMSIFEYCKQNKIVLTNDREGHTVLKGKEFVSVSDFEFTNTKNGTRGSLIDLVAAHKNMTLLQSVAHINNNPRLLLLERYAGQVPLKFKSFHVPKPEKSAPEKIAGWLQSFLQSATPTPGLSSTFHEKRIERLGSQSAVWLFLKSKPSPESFVPPLPQSARNLQHRTAAQSPGGSSHKAARHEQAIDSGVLQHQSALFAMAGVSTSLATHSIDHEIIRAIDLFLIANPGAKKLNLCSLLPADRTSGESQMFTFLKKHYGGFGIDICDVSTERSLAKAFEIDSPSPGRLSPERGMDFGF